MLVHCRMLERIKELNDLETWFDNLDIGQVMPSLGLDLIIDEILNTVSHAVNKLGKASMERDRELRDAVMKLFEGIQNTRRTQRRRTTVHSPKC